MRSRRSWESRSASLAKRLEGNKITLNLTDAAETFLAETGFDPVYGARPLKRAIQHYIQDPLAMKILEGSVKEGDQVTVDMKEIGTAHRLVRVISYLFLNRNRTARKIARKIRGFIPACNTPRKGVAEMKQNITLSLDKELIQKAKIMAANLQTSVSGFLSDELRKAIKISFGRWDFCFQGEFA
jgi:hypothetical protein